MAGRNIPIGKVLQFFLTKSSANALVNAYVLGQAPKILQKKKNGKTNYSLIAHQQSGMKGAMQSIKGKHTTHRMTSTQIVRHAVHVV